MADRYTAAYKRIAAQLREEIKGGTPPPGGMLPPITALMARFEVSKMTIANAVGELSKEGLVRAGRGQGTLVLDHRPVRVRLSRFAAVPSSGVDLGPWETACEQQGRAGRIVPVAVGEGAADPAVAERLGLAEKTTVIRRYRHALLDGRPAQLQTALYPAATFAGTPFADLQKLIGGAYAAMRTLGITPATLEESVTARGAATEEATELRLRSGSPVLTIERLTRDPRGVPLELLRIVADPMRTELVYDDLSVSPS
jgi:GntR family transcriptional regulator